MQLDIIHEGLHGAKSSGFSHREILEVMYDLDKLDFDKFAADRKKQLKAQKADINDDSMYRDEMNRRIASYCK
jgi:hypothetical protein